MPQTQRDRDIEPGRLARSPAALPDDKHRRRLLAWALAGAGLIVASAVLMPFDYASSDAIAQFAGEGTILGRVLKLPYHFFARWGFVAVPLMLLTSRRRWPLLIGFGATMAVGATVHGLKFVVGRARPQVGTGAFDFHFLGNPQLQFDSFPSAHAVFATMLAALLGLYLPRLHPVLIPLVIMVCLARVAQERHFVSDVIAGAGFGLLIVHLVARRLGPACFSPPLWGAPAGTPGPDELAGPGDRG